MNFASYLRYIAKFNSQDWDGLHREFFAEDVRAEFPIVTLTGAAESLAWYRKAHEGLHEILVPARIDVDADGRTIVADLTVRFIALADTDFIPGRALARPGEVTDVPMRATYRLNEDDRIARLDVVFTGPPTAGPPIR